MRPSPSDPILIYRVEANQDIVSKLVAILDWSTSPAQSTSVFCIPAQLPPFSSPLMPVCTMAFEMSSSLHKNVHPTALPVPAISPPSVPSAPKILYDSPPSSHLGPASAPELITSNPTQELAPILVLRSPSNSMEITPQETV